jgi:uncharacterized membrane protein/thiol-disulfide isomerase/thioredoxin
MKVMSQLKRILPRFFGFIWLTLSTPASANEPVVHAVMFWSSTCPHCHYVLEEVLPPLQQKYGAQLDILLIEVKAQEDWERLLQTAAAFDLPPEYVGVPFLIIGDRVLIGSDQIPAELPELIEQHLADGGVDYPTAPALADILPTSAPAFETCGSATPCAEETLLAPEIAGPGPLKEAAVNPSPAAALAESHGTEEAPPEPNVAMSEPIEETSLNQPPTASSARVQGFELALTVIIGMIGALIYTSAAAAKRLKNGTDCPPLAWLELAIPVLAIVGLGVAGYLTYVETQAVPAVCGPVGDCNAVQSSPYARLFGLLPIGVLGVIGYVAILVAWLWGRFRVDPLARYAPLAVFGLALVGTLFSLYLTYLEPFVIKAVCIWCLTSAVIITLILLAATQIVVRKTRAATAG